jgi:Zn-dependent M28 family amino/carboxypeptidase
VFFLCGFVVVSTWGTAISNLVAGVSQTSYQHYLADVLYTHTGDNRGVGGAQHDLARTNIYNLFQSFGLQTSLDPFTYGGSTYYNVVGVLPGAVNPTQTYLVGAHYDSVNNPGADDNASGVAGVLEAARVLSQYRFEASLVFVAFDREEQGLYGSTDYAADHAGDDLRGMISLDMIAYNPVGAHHDRAYIYGRTASNPIKNALANAMALYGGGLTSEIGGDTPYSDHAPFEARGFQAALLIEHAVWSNPNYHQAADSVDTANYIDHAFATLMTRSTVGFLATEAELLIIPEPVILGFWAVAVLVVGRRQKIS